MNRSEMLNYIMRVGFSFSTTLKYQTKIPAKIVIPIATIKKMYYKATKKAKSKTWMGVKFPCMPILAFTGSKVRL